jgi:hypothetical protein
MTVNVPTVLLYQYRHKILVLGMLHILEYIHENQQTHLNCRHYHDFLPPRGPGTYHTGLGITPGQGVGISSSPVA